MQVREISDQIWQQYLISRPPCPGLFLQSPNWIKVIEADGLTVIKLGFYKQDSLVGVGQAIVRRINSRLKYFYFPRGPLLAEDLIPAGLSALADYAVGSGYLFIRCEPASLPLEGVEGLIISQPESPYQTWLTKLDQPTEQLLAACHAKTRYNIRLSQRHKLSWQLVDESGLPDFWQLLKQTSRRDGFLLHSMEHYRNILQQLPFTQAATGGPAAAVAEVRLGKELLAGSLLIFYNQTVTYLHGASLYDRRQLMAPYLLHWRSLQQARAWGYRVYDWWGIATGGRKQNAWRGVTRFKMGWAGQILNYPGTFDYPVNKRFYQIYSFLRNINRWARKAISKF